MVQTKEILDKVKNKFPKYRPWDLNGNNTSLFLDNKETIGRQLDDNKETIGRQLDDNKETIGRQLDDKLGDKQKKLSHIVNQLTGAQKDIFNYIFHICLKRDELDTGQLSTTKIHASTRHPKTTIKKSLERLEKKGAIKRLRGKRGSGGFAIFEIPKEIKIFMINNKNYLLDDNKETIGRQLDDKLGDTSNSSSSILYLKETTTKDNQIPADWKNIDIEPLAELGFSMDCLTQLVSQNNLSSQIVQDSIYAFAFDIKENGKLKTITGDPISFFMGILKRSGRYVPPSNFESPQERCTRLYNERMVELEVKKAEIEKKALDLAFNDWFLKLTDEQKKEFLPKFWSPKSAISLDKNKMLLSCAKSHFEKELWPDVKSKIESGKL